jgi:hypothetical protein
MKTAHLTTTFPAQSRFEYALRRDGQLVAEGLTGELTLEQLTAEQRDILADGAAALDLILAGGVAAPGPGQSLRVVTTKPAENLIEYAVVAGEGIVSHGHRHTFAPEAVGGAELAALVAARNLLGELATVDATARGLI